MDPVPAPKRARPWTHASWAAVAVAILLVALEFTTALWAPSGSQDRFVTLLAKGWEVALLVALGLAAVGAVRRERLARATVIALALAALAVLGIVAFVYTRFSAYPN
jgi:hypothetical protein